MSLRSSSGLPPDGNVEEMKRVWQDAKDLSPKPMTILAALLRSPDEVEKMDIRLKVSREEKTLALFLIKHRQQLRKSHDGTDSLKPFTDFIIDVSVVGLLQLVWRSNQKSVRIHGTFGGTMWSLIFQPRAFAVSISQAAGLLCSMSGV